jgi:hypothetical protein
MNLFRLIQYFAPLMHNVRLLDFGSRILDLRYFADFNIWIERSDTANPKSKIQNLILDANSG